MTETEAVGILARWIAELQQDLDAANQRIAHLEQRVRVADDIRWWIERHTPQEVREMAAVIG